MHIIEVKGERKGALSARLAGAAGLRPTHDLGTAASLILAPSNMLGTRSLVKCHAALSLWPRVREVKTYKPDSLSEEP